MDKDTFISIWGSMAALARALGEGETTVREWFRRGSIPARHDLAIIEAAREVGCEITPTDIFELRQSISGARHAAPPVAGQGPDAVGQSGEAARGAA